jgi:hypothetical protein
MGSGSGPSTVAGFDVSGVEHSGSDTIALVKLLIVNLLVASPQSSTSVRAIALRYHTLQKYQLTKTGKWRYFRLSSGNAYAPV